MKAKIRILPLLNSLAFYILVYSVYTSKSLFVIDVYYSLEIVPQFVFKYLHIGQNISNNTMKGMGDLDWTLIRY